MTSHLLSFILFTPFIGAFLLFFVSNKQREIVHGIAATFAGLSLLGSAYLMFVYDHAAGGFQFQEQTVWSSELGISFFLGVDGIGAPMVLASAMLMFAGIFVSWHIKDRLKEFYINLLVLGSATIGVYMSLDLFFLFFFYELSVIPMYLFLVIWGRHTKGYLDMKKAGDPLSDSVAHFFNFNRSSKEYAAMKLTLYLSLGAVVALLGLLLVYVDSGLRTFNIIEIAEKGHLLKSKENLYFWLIFLGFAPIAAIFPFHSWSPVGYAAAPAAASMMHAGVLKKLGHFTIIRICFYLFPTATQQWMPIIAVICVINIFYGGLVAFLQKDTKFVVGYSSVAHMGYIFLGMASLNQISLTGAVFFLFADAMAMGLLFALAGYIYYQTHTLDIPSMGGGLASKMPFIATAFVIGSAASFGMPGAMNFIGELMVFLGSWRVYPVQTVLAAMAITITWAYYFRMIRDMFFGEPDPRMAHVVDARSLVDRLPLVLLASMTIFFGLYPAPFINVIQSGVSPILARMAAPATPSLPATAAEPASFSIEIDPPKEEDAKPAADPVSGGK
ncbi:MAG: NADH-quinone oxidoreductase subunit M [Candidatus Manganitrophus sp. SA1]|nr:NADH-quinone oxidoreductase subunit M [Candidatus Manganitrophus morganii]